MNTQELVSLRVREFKEALLQVGPLKRVSKAQKARLDAACSLILGLPLEILGEHRLSQRRYLCERGLRAEANVE